jgi:hypothetical protein
MPKWLLIWPMVCWGYIYYLCASPLMWNRSAIMCWPLLRTCTSGTPPGRTTAFFFCLQRVGLRPHWFIEKMKQGGRRLTNLGGSAPQRIFFVYILCSQQSVSTCKLIWFRTPSQLYVCLLKDSPLFVEGAFAISVPRHRCGTAAGLVCWPLTCTCTTGTPPRPGPKPHMVFDFLDVCLVW